LKSLNEGTFYTAVELATHIKNNYGKVLSRSIISRHLGEMGYSYKNIKSKPTNRNSPHIKELRKKFSAAFCLLRDKYQAYVYYID
jgi:transposase